jgi:hypothetical protein
MIGGTAKSKNSGAVTGVIEVDLGDQWEIRDIAGDRVKRPKDEIEVEYKPSGSVLPILNIIMAVLSFTSGVYWLAELWPSTSRFGGANASILYLPAFGAFFTCLLSTLIFANFAALLNKK